jgi:Flp pilus assembly protein TadG
MLRFAGKFLKREKGIATVELALVTPIFLMLFLSIIELGHMIYYSITLEKALRSAATWVGRNEVMTAAVMTAAENIAKTGTPNGIEYVVPGWADPLADVTLDQKIFTVNYNGNTQDLNETVYIISIRVPYEPVVGVLVPALEYLMKSSIYQGKIMIELTHEQALIGN